MAVARTGRRRDPLGRYVLVVSREVFERLLSDKLSGDVEVVDLGGDVVLASRSRKRIKELCRFLLKRGVKVDGFDEL